MDMSYQSSVRYLRPKILFEIACGVVLECLSLSLYDITRNGMLGEFARIRVDIDLLKRLRTVMF